MALTSSLQPSLYYIMTLSCKEVRESANDYEREEERITESLQRKDERKRERRGKCCKWK